MYTKRRIASRKKKSKNRAERISFALFDKLDFTSTPCLISIEKVRLEKEILLI